MKLQELLREERQEGRIEGRAEGILEVITMLVKKGRLSLKEAAEELNISEEEFKVLMEKNSEK